MSAISREDEVSDEVLAGVHDAVKELLSQSGRAIDILPSLQNFAGSIFHVVKVDHPEAKCSFGRHQDGEGFQLKIYAASTEWDLYELVSHVASDRILRDLSLHLMLLGLDEAEE